MEKPKMHMQLPLPCNDLTVTLNYQGKIITCNPIFEKVTGIRVLPQITHYFKDVLSPSYSISLPSILEEIINHPLSVFCFKAALINKDILQEIIVEWKSFTDPARKQIFLIGSQQNSNNSDFPLSNKTFNSAALPIEGIVTLENDTILQFTPTIATLFEWEDTEVQKESKRSINQQFPLLQPDGSLSKESFISWCAIAKEQGVAYFPWVFRTTKDKLFTAKIVLFPWVFNGKEQYQLIILSSSPPLVTSKEPASSQQSSSQKESIDNIQTELLSLIIDNAPIAIFVKEYINDDFVFTMWNNQAEKVYGIPREKVIGYPLSQVFPPEIAALRRTIDLEVIHKNETIRNPNEIYSHPTQGPLILDITRVPLENKKSQKKLILGISRDITLEKQKEAELEKAQHRLQDVLRLAQVATWNFDLQKRVVELDDLYWQWIGIDPKKRGSYTISLKEFAQNYVHSEDRMLLQAATDRAIQATNPNYSEHLKYRMITAQGQIRYIAVSFMISKNEQGITTHAYGNAQDITEKYLAEEEIRNRSERKARQEKVLEFLAKNELITQGNTEAALRLITEKLSEGLQVARSSIWLLDENKTKITALDIYEAPENRHSGGVELFRKDFPTYFLGLAQERTISAGNAHTHPYTYEFSETYLTPLKINSMLDTPIRRGGKMIGVICNEHVGPFRNWHEDEENFCALVANLIAIVFENEEKTKLLQSLQEKDRFLVAAMQSANLATWQYDCTHQVLQVEEKYFTFLGFKHPPEIKPYLDTLFYAYCAPTDKGALEAFFEKALQAKDLNYKDTLEYKILPKDCDERYLSISVQVIFDSDGKIQKLYGTLQDITTRKQQEIQHLALLAKKQKLDASLTQLARQDLLSTYVTLDEALGHILQTVSLVLEVARVSIWEVIKTEEHSYLNCFLLFDSSNSSPQLPSPLEPEKFPLLWQSLATGEIQNIKYARYDERIKAWNDDYFSPLGVTSLLVVPIYRGGQWQGILWLEHKGIVRQFQEEEINYAQSITDFITLTYETYERNQLLKQITENEKKLEEALRIANLSRWEYDVATHLITVDQRYLSIYGLYQSSTPYLTDTPEKLFFPYVHPEDVDLLQKTIQQALQTNDPNFSTSLEYKIIRPDGEIRYIGLSIRIQVDELQKKVEKIFGTGQDITTRKIKEIEEQQQSQRKQKYSQTLAALATAEKVKENTTDLLPILADYLQVINQTLNYLQASFWIKQENQFLCLVLWEEGIANFRPGYIIQEQNCPYTYALLQDPKIYTCSSEENVLALSELVTLPLLNSANVKVGWIPVYHTSKLLGYLAFALNENQPIYSEDIDFLNNLADIVSTSYKAYERYQLLRQLAEKEIRLSDAIHISGLFTWELDAESQVFIAEENTWHIFGLNSEQLKNTPFSYKEFIKHFYHPEDQENAITFYQNALETTQEQYYSQAEFRIVPLNYDLRYLRVSVRCTTDVEAGKKKIFGTLQDITQQKLAEQQEKQATLRKEKFNIALSEIAKLEVSQENTLETFFSELVQIGARTLEVQRLGIWFFNESQDELFCGYLYNAQTQTLEEPQEWTAQAYPTLFNYLLKGENIAVKFARYNEITQELSENYLLPHNIASLELAPIWRGGKLMGYLIAEQFNIARTFLLDEQNFLAALADAVVINIETHEKNEALQLLKEKEIKLQDAMEVAKLGTWELNPYTLEITVDERWLTFHGLNIEELGSYTLHYPEVLSQIYSPEDAEFILNHIEQIRNQPSTEGLYSTFEFKIQPSNLSAPRYVIYSMRIIEDASGNKKILGTCQDITQRKLEELEKIQAQTRKLKFEEALSQLAKDKSLTEGNWEDVLEKISVVGAQTIKVDFVGIFWWHFNRTLLICQKLYNALESKYEQISPLPIEDAPLFFAATDELQELPIENAPTETLLAEIYPTYLAPRQIQSILWVPIQRGQEKLGYITFETTQTHTWLPDEVEFTYSLADLIIIAWDAYERKLNMQLLAQKEEELSKLVQEKTQALEQLKNTQQQLIQSEKMASLGQLIAGVAHEVNTPISAVKASARNMARALPVVLQEIPLLLKSLSDEDTQLFMKMVNQSTTASFELTTQEERKYRAEVKKILDEYDIEDSYELAKELVEVRLIHNIEDYIPLFEHENSHELLDKAYKLGQFKKNLDNIEIAAEKTARVVMALKSYSHVQQTDRLVPVFLHESLETILTIYHNQLKYGIAVERQYQEFEPVPVYPDEIGQVWTNIISNAIHAMKGKGKLIVNVRKEEPWAVVSITDNGPGIPPEIMSRIFEPFFTTKPQGEGTGLGLDICRKIVEKHRGKIEVDSEPGRTTFTVKIPLVQPEFNQEQA
ncbi:MAG: PAS domain S-box protein [Bacteroidia bacterium]|nr:PAS domain S-box protein [Bacteroidia bacterium]MDW8157452.1 PAS domain S-box protein [Bacteroidia bacterium]